MFGAHACYHAATSEIPVGHDIGGEDSLGYVVVGLELRRERLSLLNVEVLVIARVGVEEGIGRGQVDCHI